MTRKLIITALVTGLSWSTASTAFAERGPSTFSGKTSEVDYAAPLGSMREGDDRCNVTICGKPTIEGEQTEGQGTSVGKRRTTGHRLGVAPCHSTFCGPPIWAHR